MPRKAVLTLVFLILVLSSCAKSQIVDSTSTASPVLTVTRTLQPTLAFTPTATRSATPTPQLTETRTPSPTVSPTRTPTSTRTPTPTLTPYPTFDVTTVQTHVPFLPAQCPPEDPEHVVDFVFSFEINPGEYGEIVSQLLEEGASFEQVVKAFQETSVELIDLTGDGVQELMIRPFFHTIVFGCDKENYRVILDYFPVDSVDTPRLSPIEDMNRNGIPEVLVEYHASSAGSLVVDLIEWDGEQFINLIQSNHGDDALSTSRLAKGLYWYSDEWNQFNSGKPFMEGYAEIRMIDIDHNGILELILTDQGPGHLDTLYNYGPWRGKRVIFTWDGLHYLYSSLEMDPPQYRFQAVQDADRLFFMGEYDQSLELYREVIFNQDLDWWSPEKMDNLAEVFLAERGTGPTPTPLPPDTDEAKKLAAYARYRIVLHHLARGWVGDANTVYQGLLERYPDGSVGFPYVEMATILWDAYQEEPDLSLACEPVVAYARSHPEILAPLGDKEHGEQSHQYVSEDVCPIVWEFK